MTQNFRWRRNGKYMIAAMFWAAAELQAQTAHTLGIRVTETAGIRRTAFPVNARVLLPQAVVRVADNARLMLNGKEVAAQYSAETRWPDGSVEWLDVDYNASIGPDESVRYELEYGEGVHAAEAPRGLIVTGEADAIQVGSIRFSRSGSPLILSVKYRGEEIGRGLNGLFVTDQAGLRHDVSSAELVETEVLKNGPMYAVLRYSGNIVIDSSYQVPFALKVEMPNSKTLVKITAVVIDPAKRIRELAIETPLAFGTLPLIWDFGTSRWTYGSLRTGTDSVTLTNAGNDWSVMTAGAGREQLYEKSGITSAGRVLWGHIQDAKEAVAFALESPPENTGDWRVRIEGGGQISFRYVERTPVTQHRIAVYEHFVTTPVQIGAATSPSAILNPLTVAIEGR